MDGPPLEQKAPRKTKPKIPHDYVCKKCKRIFPTPAKLTAHRDREH